MTIDDLKAEFAGLALPRFDETTALRLGAILVDLAQGKPVVINIRNANRTFFHAALPGSQAENDHWARRKGNMALFAGQPSMLGHTQIRATRASGVRSRPVRSRLCPEWRRRAGRRDRGRHGCRGHRFGPAARRRPPPRHCGPTALAAELA